jgi:hypothetical protein
LITRLLGNGILRAKRLEHYTDNASAAAIGGMGGIIATTIFSGIFMALRKDENRRTNLFIFIVAGILSSTLTGTIGCAILQHNHVDLGPIDVLHATCAGALGGVIIKPVALAVALIFNILCLCLIWVFGLLSEHVKMLGNYSSGTCGKDVEMNEEIETFGHG